MIEKPGMELKRRGIMFTFVVIIALSVLFVIAYGATRYSTLERQRVYETRILTMNDFINSFESDAERAIYISGFRTLIAMEDYVSHNAEFVNDTNYYFKQIFYEGYVREDNFTFDIMNASTFNDYEKKVNSIANDVNLRFNSSVRSIELSMANPWVVRVTVHMDINLSDRTGLARWEYNKSISGDIPITDLRDPLYSVKTIGKLPVLIRQSPYKVFVNDTDDMNDTTNLQDHLNESYYINNTDAPNFLMRFEGNFSPDPNGIESLVNLQVLADQGWVIGCNDISVVDYLYFNETETDVWCNIQNMIFTPDNWFILDTGHVDTYQINGTLEHGACYC